MITKSIISIVAFSLLYSFVVLLLTPFLVTWGAPKAFWQEILIFLYSFPIDIDAVAGEYFFTSILLDGLFWGLLLTGLSELLKYLRTHFKSVV
jgi:hypothetical protein